VSCTVFRILIPALVILGQTTGQSVEVPNEEIRLIDGQLESGELPGWRSFHEDGKARTRDVWKLTADGVLVSKGTPKGYLSTEKQYLNFVLRLEWRRPDGKKPGNGGVLVRMTGQDKIWPKSLEAQLNAGAAGDFWGLDGYRLAGPPERTTSLEHPQFGKLTNVKKIRDAQKPPGQWNEYEIIADGEVVTLKINGHEVNKATGCDAVPGRICLTAEGDEIHFRHVRLTPIRSRKRQPLPSAIRSRSRVGP
jgi:hypothetical protein